MDHKLSKPDTDSFVDDRMARLDPSPDWKPDTGRALKELTQRKSSASTQWMRLGMTATILAATVFVLVLLPWQRLWTPKPVVTVAAQTQTQTAPAEKPVEKIQHKVEENPAPKEPSVAAQQTPAAPTPEQVKGDSLRDLPDSEQDLLHYLEELAKQRATSAQASQANYSNPVVVNSVIPEYSDEAKKERIKGTVIVRVKVNTDGTAQFESFQQTLGYGLDEKAREAVEKWLFTPAKKDGVAVAAIVDLNINFSLR